MKLKKYKRKTLGNHISREVIILVVSIICSLVIIDYFYKRFNEIIIPLAEESTKKHVTEIINNATKDIKFDSSLFAIERNDDNEIKMITYDSYESTKLINKITDNIQTNLLKLEDNDGNKMTIMEIPLGIIFKNNLIRNFGPKIKIKFEIIGNVLSELNTEVKPYGINNALVEVRVKLKANAKVVLPFKSKDIVIENIIPISINIVNGSIPEAYISSFR